MRTRSAGFTLIEVLVAIAIVAIGMAAVLESLTASANTVLYLKDKTLAEWVGLNEIATTRLQLQPGQVPMQGNTTGDMDFAGRSWHWRQEVTATQVVGIVQIDVKVRPADVKAGDDNGWFATVSGIAGDALAASQGTTPTWGIGGAAGAGGTGQSCQAGTAGCQCQQGVCTQQCPPGVQGCTTTQQQQPCPAGQVCNQTPPNQPGMNPAPAPAPSSGGLGGGDDLGSGGLGGDTGGLGGGNSGGLGGNDSGGLGGNDSGGLGGNNSGGLGSGNP